MTKKQYLLAGFLLFFLVGAFLYGQYRQVRLEKCLKESGQYTTGIVKEVYHYKGKNVNIYFKVRGKTYLAGGKAYDAKDPVNVGDRFYIHYCPENPKRNRILFDRRVAE